MKKKVAIHILNKVIKKNEEMLNAFRNDEFWDNMDKAEKRVKHSVDKVGNMDDKEASPIIEKVGYVRKDPMFDKHYHVTLEDCVSKYGNEVNWKRIGDSVRKARITIEYLE